MKSPSTATFTTDTSNNYYEMVSKLREEKDKEITVLRVRKLISCRNLLLKIVKSYHMVRGDCVWVGWKICQISLDALARELISVGVNWS